jgi:hypothetical protein
MSAAAAAATDKEGDYLDYQDLTLPLDPKLIFEAPPQHFQSIVYVKRQHELLDNAIRAWIRRTRECQSGIAEQGVQPLQCFGFTIESLLSSLVFSWPLSPIIPPSLCALPSPPKKKKKHVVFQQGDEEAEGGRRRKVGRA